MEKIEKMLLEEVKPEDIAEPQKDLVEAIGMKAFIQGTMKIGGGSWYFPTVRKLLYNVKKRKVMEEYNGNNIKKLATKYNIAESSAYKIIEESRSQKKENLS